MSLRFESGTHLHLFQLCWIPFEPTEKGYFYYPLAIHLLVIFYSPDKEPADVFPRRARLGPSRDITEFA